MTNTTEQYCAGKKSKNINLEEDDLHKATSFFEDGRIGKKQFKLAVKSVIVSEIKNIIKNSFR